MELPIVNHKDYFAKIGDDHKFPINKFGELANYLIKKKIVKKFYIPYACSEETLKRAHRDNYIKNIKNMSDIIALIYSLSRSIHSKSLRAQDIVFCRLPFHIFIRHP